MKRIWSESHSDYMSNDMKERIILAPGLNGAELTQSLALHGVNSIGLRICGSAELARLALMRSGISISENFISTKEEAGIVAKAVNGVSYFGKASFSDIQEIASAIRRMRGLIASADEAHELERILSQGVFKEKNMALLNVYREYMNTLTQQNAVDAVSLIRMAAEKSKVIEAEFLTLEEYPLNPLETHLLNRISGGKVTETSLHKMFNVVEGNTRIKSIKNCYGAPNEVESILGEIYDKERMDQCTVVVTDGVAYSQLFFDYAILYNIPVTFGCGIPIVNSNPAGLLSLYYKWITGGFFGSASLNEMFTSKSFDRTKFFDKFSAHENSFSWSAFFDVLGSLRLTNSSETNKKRIDNFKKAVNEEARLIEKESKDYNAIQSKLAFIPYLEIAANELALPVEEFIFKYAYIRKSSDTNADRLVKMLDISASKAIYDELKVIRNFGAEQYADDIIPNILKLNVCSQRSESGKLHITGIEGAFAAIRKNLYIAGLSASNFPGTPRENYLLLDEDLKLFGKEAEILTADGKIRRKRDELLMLVNLASSLNSDISVSYAGLNVSELKKDNPSSMIFELFRKEHGSTATSGELEQKIRKIDYFKPAVSVSRLVGKAYTDGYKIQQEVTDNPRIDSVPWSLEKAWSPTALDTFFGCPRKFMLKYILGIPEPEDYDPFEIISAMDIGTLAHSLMEVLGRESMDAEAFERKSEEYFDHFLIEHPPLIAENVPAVRDQFLDMMKTACEMDPRREIALKEEDIYCTHESGVKLHGFPDRVEKLDDGTYQIVDFKSSRSIKHIRDDINTCLQVIIYAYLMEQKGFKVSGCEYRYIRLGETVTCRYDNDMKEQLSDRLLEFGKSMLDGSFETAKAPEEGDDPCKYCKYRPVCGKLSDSANSKEGETE